jgi:hypothetical protein
MREPGTRRRTGRHFGDPLFHQHPRIDRLCGFAEAPVQHRDRGGRRAFLGVLDQHREQGSAWALIDLNRRENVTTVMAIDSETAHHQETALLGEIPDTHRPMMCALSGST